MDKGYRPFTWADLGDVGKGRENLGGEMPIVVYRLFEYTMKDVLARRFGVEEAKSLIRECGALAGKEFYHNVLKADGLGFEDFVALLQKALRDYKIGVLKLERAEPDNRRLTLAVAEDIDCSGMDVTEDAVCNYDEGFISGILKEYTGISWDVTEVDCWATGDRVCRFRCEAVD